jgi:RNA polymerase sigma factor (sigma-70 family)
VKKCSADELRAAHQAQDWRLLWEQALPLVKFTITRLIRSGRLDSSFSSDDLLQEGNLAAGAAVRSWHPDKGAFSTWVMRRVHGAIQDHIRREAGGMIGGRRAHGSTTALDESLTDGTEITVELDRQEMARAMYHAVKSLSDRHRYALGAAYDSGPETFLNMAKAYAPMSERTQRRLLKEARKKLAAILGKWRYLSEVSK